jgi:hypothetical protein
MPSVRLLLALALLGACDPALRRDGVGGAAAAAPGPRAGREGESCARVADCAEPLRCVEEVCVPAATSAIGELHWAAAAVAGETGESRAALYQKATAQYEADEIPVPAALLCEHGRYLLGQPAAQSGEQAARLLHRCVLASPPGSRLRRGALEDLARLGPRGLDPALLARSGPADTYLVNPPAPPPAERLEVEVARTTPAGDRGYAAFVELLEGPKARPALAGCYREQWLRTHQPRMTATLPLKLRARFDHDEEYAGGTLEIGADAGDAVATCLRGALAPLAAELAKVGSSGSWHGAVTVTVSPR